MAASRVTFLINTEEKRIVHAWLKVFVIGHTLKVLYKIRDLLL